jgi:hypothetical protein
MTAGMQEITQETLEGADRIAKAAAAAGIYASSGFYGYDLSSLVSLVPVVTPFRDLVARETPEDGNPFAVWRSLMNVNSSQLDPAMGVDFAANEATFEEQDFQAKYMPTGYSGNVTQDSVDFARGYTDPYALATFQTLNQCLIGDDRKQLGAQSFPLAAAAAPSITQVGSGGSIGAVQVYVGVAARTGSGYYYGSGNSQGNSNSTTFGSGAANSLTASAAAIRGAVLYDWFQSSNGTTWYYYTSTTTNTVTMTKVITQAQALPGLADLSTMWQGAAGTPTYNAAADNGSGNPKDYDGFLASLSGDYTATGQWAQPGTGTPNPSVWTSLNGAALTLTGGSVNEIAEYIFLTLWNSVKCSPTALMMNAAQAQEIANLIVGSGSATTFLNTDAAGRISVTAGGRVGEIINTSANVTVPIEVHVSLPPGTIIGRTDRVPFPQAEIENVIAQRCLRDTAQFDYGISRVAGVKGGGPRREFEIRSVSAFCNRAPVAMATLSCVA